MFREYLALEIQISALEAEQFLLSAKGPGGDARAIFTLPLADATYQALAARLDQLDVDDTALEQLGQMLFHSLFQGAVRDIYTRTLAILSADQGLRIILNISPTAAKVAALPWEFLNDPDHGPLALLDSSIVRFLPQPSIIPTLATSLPLRVLLTGAQVSPQLDVDRELQEVQAGLARLHDHIQLTIDPHITLARFQQLLRDGFHIWHFVGSGTDGGDGKTSALLFEDDAHGQRVVSAQELRILLNRSGLRLVMLDAGNTVKLVTDPFRSVASALIGAQIPAVVAMQFTAPQESPRAFVGEFYRALAEGFPIDACATEGRKAVMNAVGLGRADWGIPVIYTRAPDGKLFDLPAPIAYSPIPAHTPGIQEPPTLQGVMREPEVYAILVSCWRDFQAARKRLSLLHGYKDLHDLFQQLDSSYAIIARTARRLTLDKATQDAQIDWGYLQNEARALREAIEKVLDAASRISAAESDALWARKLDRAYQDLDVAMTHSDGIQLLQAIRLVSEVLSRESSRVNTRLVVAASEVRMHSLVDMLRTLGRDLESLELGRSAVRQVQAFHHTVDQLAKLAERLDILIGNQDNFQEIEDELRRVEASLDRDLSELEVTWQSLKPKIQQLCDGVQERWAARLNELGTQLERLLTTASTDPARIKATFLDYRSQVNRSFNSIDWDLRTLCGALVDTSEDLTPILGIAA